MPKLTEVLYRNFGGPRTNRMGLLSVPPHKLWDTVLNRRALDKFKGENQIMAKALLALKAAGLEDPFEITPEIRNLVRNLIDRFNPKSELSAAILLFRSLLPPNKKFKFDKAYYFGLQGEYGGLEITHSDFQFAPLRMKFGSLLPNQIVTAPPEKRVARSIEYSYLLTVMLRAAGISARVKSEPSHAYVITILDGVKYRLDIGNLLFFKTQEPADCDRKGISIHYSGKGLNFSEWGRSEEAMRFFDTAIEINLKNTEAWFNKGREFCMRGKFEDAADCYEKATEYGPNNIESWFARGFTLAKLCKYEKAISCFDEVLKAMPEHIEALFQKAAAYENLKKLEEALSCYDRIIEIEKDDIEAWTSKARVLNFLERSEEANKCLERIKLIKKKLASLSSA